VICAGGCGRTPVDIRDSHGGWWCAECARLVLGDMRLFQTLSPEDLGTAVAILRDWKMDHMARIAIGSLPFDEPGPSEETMDWLADE